MKRLALIFLFLVSGLMIGYSQSVPFPSTQPNWGQIGPWGYNNTGTNWDTSPFLPYIYKGIPFRLMRPVNFNAARAEKYPLILFLHGVGERGGDNNNQLKNGGQAHRDAVQSGRFEGFLLYPQSYYGSWGGTINDYVVEIINIYIRDFNVDPNRIYVHGLSGGGAGTWMMLQSYPKVFAAGLPMSNALLSVVPDMPKFKHVPIWYAQGGLDKAPPPSAGEAMRDAFWAVGGELRYQYFPSLGHGTWNSMYAMPDFFEWMLERSKLRIHVDGGRTNFCPGQTINVRMGITGGFDGYQWMKDGVLMAATTNEIANNGAGSYQVRFRRGTVWTSWSQPIVLQFAAPSPTPLISANGGTTFPALDGRTSVTLSGPAGKEFYRWSTGATTQSITVSAAGSYTLTATDYNGCESLVSAPQVVTTANGAGSPVAVTGFSANSTSETVVELSWNYTGTAQKRFELYRSVGNVGGPYTLLGLLDKDLREYSDGNLAANTNYFYQIRATNDSGGSAYSVTDAFTFKDVQAPTVPTEFMVTNTSETSLTLSWKSSTDNINGLGSIVYDLVVNGQVREMNATNSNPFPINLAAGKTTVASTFEGTSTNASMAVDGSLNTYWSSATGALEGQDWIYVDLGEEFKISSANLRWTTDYAVGYKIQISNDAATWTDVKTVTGNSTTINNFTDIVGTGRYVRVLATLRRSANRRVRLVELQVFGNKLNGQDQPYIGTVITGLTPRSNYTLSVRARDVSGNTSAYVPQISGLTVNNGLAYNYYEATLTSLSQLSSYSPVETGRVRNFDLTPRNRNTNFAFVYEGYITVPTNGLYTFYTTSVDGSSLYISNYLIVNNDGRHSSQERSGQIVLSPGTYPIRVEYFKNGSGTLQLQARYEGPGIAKVLIPESAMNSDITPPAVPGNPSAITATAQSHKTIKVDWQYNSAVAASGFEIYRGSTPEGTFSLVATVAGSMRTYTDVSLTPNTQYYYRVRTVGASGESAIVKGEPTTPGITYKYYVGNFANLNAPYFGGIAPTATGSLTNYSLTPATVTTNYGFLYEGYIVIPTTGSYTFFTRSDDGSRLLIGETAVVANDFSQSATERSGTISLTAGTYPITVLYRQLTGGATLEVRYQGPSIAKQLIPAASLKSITYVSATTQAIPAAPGLPLNLTATTVNGSEIDLSWSSAPTTEGVKVFRSTAAASGFVQIGSVLNTTSYSDTTVQSKTTYYYKVSAFNDGGESAQTPSVSASTPNTPPTLEAIADINLLIQTPSAIEVHAHDADGDELQYAFANLPVFASFQDFGDGYGNLNLNPGINDAGTYQNIVLTINDGFGGIARDTFQIYVNGNHTPVMQTAIGNQSLTAGKRIVLQLVATDGNAADNVTFSSQNLPSFVSLVNTANGRATLTIAPPLAERGTYGDIVILAEDGNGAAAVSRFNIEVKEAKTGYTVLVNFNDQWDTPAPSPWNNTQRYPTAGSVMSNLLDTDLANSEVSVTLVSGWAPNYTGPVTGNNSGVFPDPVSKTFYYIWDNRVQTVRIGGLNPGLTYNFSMLAATTNASVGGPTRYTISGQSVDLNPLNNTANLATISNIVPDADGNVTLAIQTGAGAIYSYINGLKIEASYYDENPPAAPSNLVASISAQQNSVLLTWKDNSPSETGFKLYRSLLADSDFVEVASLGANVQGYEDLSVSSNLTYYYKVLALNDNGSSDFSNTATIATPAIAPVILASPSATVAVEATQSATVNLTSTDAGGLPVTLSVSNLPSFVLFNTTGAGTANLVVIPSVNDLGHYVVTVTATNTANASSTKDIVIDVTPRQVRAVYVNFNVGYIQASPWNNTNLAPLANASFSNLLDDQSANSGISLRLTEAWTGVNSVGTVTGNNTGVFPDNVMKTFYYEQTNAARTITVSGLNPTKVYDFSFFGSREGTGDRTTVYTIGTKSASLNASNNTTQTADLNGIIAPTGSLTITIQKTTSSSFAYLNALVIRSYNQTAVPVAPTNLVARSNSKTSVELKWVDGSYNESGFEIYRATLANPNYELVATAAANASVYVDQSLQSNTTYFYKVRSVNGDAPSPFSNIASVTTILNYIYVNANSGYNVGSPWNNLNLTPIVGSRRSGLRNDEWSTTTVGFNVVEHPNGTTFGGANPFGRVTGNNSGIYPDDVLRTFFFTEATDYARMTYDGLSANYTYNFVFFASRDGDGNRNTNYTIGSSTVTLNAAFNISNTVQINGVKPDANGVVTIDLVSAPGSVYGYVNAMVLEMYTEVPIVGGSSAKVKGSNAERPALAEAYPNPLTDEHKDIIVKIVDPGEAKSFSVSMVNQLGVSIHTSSFSIDAASGNESLTHKIENLKIPAGIYYVNVVSDKNRREVIKIVKP